MERREEEADLGSLSFRMESPEKISAADELIGHEDGDYDDDDFEFSFVGVPELGTPIAADDVFSDGKIRPMYPVFDRDLLRVDRNGSEEKGSGSAVESRPVRLPLRRLFMEEEEEEQASFSSESSSSSSAAEELDGIPPGTYCVWTPPAAGGGGKGRCKKSSSTGSASRRCRLRDLVGGRSHSDGGEKLLFIPIQPKELGGGSKKEAEKNKKLLGKKSTDLDSATHGQDFGRVSGRKSYLPYKQDLIGFFANVNGLSNWAQSPF